MTEESRVIASGGAFVLAALATAYLGPWHWQWTLRRRIVLRTHGLHGLPTRRDLLRAFGRFSIIAAGLLGVAGGVGSAFDAWLKDGGHPRLEWSAEAVAITAGLLGILAALFAALMLVGSLLWHRRQIVPTSATLESLTGYLDAVTSGEVSYDDWRDWDVVRYQHPKVEAVRHEAAELLTARPRELSDPDLERLRQCGERLRACRHEFAAD